MAIRAYDECYVNGAQEILGDAFDFAINTLGIDNELFSKAFVVSDVSSQFAAGNPRYVAGMNGCELARCVLKSSDLEFDDVDDIMYVNKSPEYWVGWALAYYQWYSDRSFYEILKVVPLGKLLSMYPVYHEMDIMQFVDYMQEKMRASWQVTKLRAKRELCGYSQADLAFFSGVPLRQIQLFEQCRRDINKTSALTLLKLSRALNCRMEDLLEKQTIEQE